MPYGLDARYQDDILERFQLFQGGTGGLDSWLRPEMSDEVFDVLADLETHPLTRARFNQLLASVLPVDHLAPLGSRERCESQGEVETMSSTSR